MFALMELDQALATARELLAPEHLNSAQELVFRESWAGQSYGEIAQTGGYDANYIRGVGSQLWRSLGTATAERVSKNNFRQIIEGLTPAQTGDLLVVEPAIGSGKIAISLNGYPQDLAVFYGRQLELQQLTDWIVKDRCQVVMILGMGGMGKTTLAHKVVRELEVDFRCIVWRSLLNAPLLRDLLIDVLRVLIDQLGLKIGDARWQKIAGENGVAMSLELLLEIFQQHRCAIVLDNCESLLQSGLQVGKYLPGWQDYAELFSLLGRCASQGCLILTSREKPIEISLLEGIDTKVKTLLLAGLDSQSGRQIFVDRGCLPISLSVWTEIDEYYGGNPLVFQLVAAVVKDIADGDVSEILAHLRSGQLLADIQLLLDRQWDRLTAAERQVMYHLAIHREPMDLVNLSAALHPTWTRQADSREIGVSLLTILQSLRRRSIISLLAEPTRQWFLAPMLITYVTGKFVSQICTEIELQQPGLLDTHALIRSTDPEYLRQAQIRLMIEPIVLQIRSSIGCPLKIGAHLKGMLAQWRTERPLSPGYIAGNLLNLLIYLKQDLTNLDCSDLVVWQADFTGIELFGVNFARAQMMNCVFTQTFGCVLAVACSPDGETFATSDSGGEIRLWRSIDRQYLLTCVGHTNWIRSIAFSPDGQYLASVSDDLTIRLWDVQTGMSIRTFCSGSQHFGLSLSHDGRYLASGSHQGTIYCWEVLTGQYVSQFVGLTGRSTCVKFHPHGGKLIAGSADGTIAEWTLNFDLAPIHPNWLLPAHQNSVTAIDYSPDGNRILTSSLDGKLLIWDTTGGLPEVRVMGAEVHSSRSAQFSPDGASIASGGADGIVRIWRTSDGECEGRLTGHTQLICSVVFHPSGRYLISGSEDRTIRYWRVRDQVCLQRLRGSTNWFHSIAQPPDGDTLISASCDARIRIWDFQQATPVSQLSGHTQPIRTVVHDSQGQTFASGSEDRTIRIWDARSYSCLHILRGHTAMISTLAYSPDGKYLVSGGACGTIRIWEVDRGRCLQIRHGHTDRICDLAYHPDGHSIASASEDGTIKIWDTQQNYPPQTLSLQQSHVVSIVFNPSGTILASGDTDGKICLWNIQTGELLHTLSQHHGRILTMIYSTDGRWLISGAADGNIWIWSMETNIGLKKLTGHQSWVLSLSLDPAQKYLASASQDETIRLWDITTGDLISTRRSTRAYEGMNISDVEGLTKAQIDDLKILGAKDGLH